MYLISNNFIDPNAGATTKIDPIAELRKQIKERQNQTKAFTMLTAAGVKYKAALDAVQNAELAALIVSGAKNGKLKEAVALVNKLAKETDKYNKTYELVQKLEKSIVYDQIILEYRYKDQVWIHTGYKATGNRKMAFTMVNDKTYKRNEKGLPYGFYLIDTIPPKGSV